MFKGVKRVIDHKRAPQTVAVLRRDVAVVPECSCGRDILVLDGVNCQHVVLTSLVRDVEVIQERMAGCNGALVHKPPTVRPICMLLKESVPVLSQRCSPVNIVLIISKQRVAYNTGRLQHRMVRHIINHVDLKMVALRQAVSLYSVPRASATFNRAYLVPSDERARRDAIDHDCVASKAVGGDDSVGDDKVRNGADSGECTGYKCQEDKGMQRRDVQHCFCV